LRESGVGLGLAISRRIIDAHGGSISVASEVDEGTTFTVVLRTDAPDAPASIPVKLDESPIQEDRGPLQGGIQ